MGGWRRVGLLLAVLGAGVAAAVALRARLSTLGPLTVVPTESRPSVRVGESLDFSAEAAGATGYTWSIWGRVVSHEPTWRYVPTPEDAGWQQVMVTANGRGGKRAARTWDVGVLTEVPPELVDVTPPPGQVAAMAGVSTRFRCGARVVAARSTDRLRFEWSVDGQTVAEEERPAASAASQFELPVSAVGSHSVTVRVTEDDRVSSLAEWRVDVGPAAVATAPGAPQPPPVPILRRLVRAPVPWRVDGHVGEQVEFRSGLAPATGEVSYDWKVDGRAVQKGPDPSLAFTPSHTGTHRVIVTVLADVGAIGVDAWRLEVAKPELAAATPPVTVTTTVPPTRVAVQSTVPPIPITVPSTTPALPITVPSTVPPPPITVPSTAPPTPITVPSTTPTLPITVPSTVPPAPVSTPSTVPPPPVAVTTTVPSPRVTVTTTVPPPPQLAAAPKAAVPPTPSTTIPAKRVEPPPKVVAAVPPPAREPAPSEAPRREPPAPPRDKEKTRALVAVEPEPPAPVPGQQAAARPPSPEPPPPRASDGLGEDEVRRWLEEYAHAWSRRDVGALRRMGQIRSDGEEERLVRYFGNVQELHVDVRLRSLRVDGDHAAVEFERTDTVTDPAGRRQELRLPIQHKEIRRIPGGLRFAE